MPASDLGCPISELDTPALLLDLDRLEANMQTISSLCRKHGVAWRPHSKGHKSPTIATMELSRGAIGVTCAKLGEAEVMAASGVRDLLIANQIVGSKKLARLAALCHVADPIVCVDDGAQVLPMSEACAKGGVRPRVLLEVDIGMHRAGVLPGEAAVKLAKLIAAQPSLQLAGIMGYEGHLLNVEDQREKQEKIRAAIALLVSVRDDLLAAGLPCPIVSAGGTGSYATTVSCPGITEIQAGGLILMDAYYRQKCHVQEFEFALSLVTTIVSRPTPDRAIIDAGRKTQFAETCPPIFVGRDDIKLVRLSAEHGQLELAPSAQHLKVGDRLELIPGYSDFTTVLHDEFLGCRNGRVEAVLPLVGRGKIR